MLVDANYRGWVVRQVRDPFVKQFWEQEFENYDPRFMREAIAPIQNKVGALLQSPMLRNILGQIRNRVSIPFTMDNRHIRHLIAFRVGHTDAAVLASEFGHEIRADAFVDLPLFHALASVVRRTEGVF